MLTDTVTREIVRIDETKQLSGELAYPAYARPSAMVLLLCPHPFMGGTMQNNVIRHLASALAEAGYVTLRFDYAPVPDNVLAENMAAFWQTGHAPQDESLIDDARSAQRWLMRQFNLPQALVGYSFGAHVVTSLLDADTVGIVLISPTVTHHDLAPLRMTRLPKLVLYSNNDFATPQLATDTWYADLAEPKQKHCFVNGDHFFKKQESSIAEVVTSFFVALFKPEQESMS